MRSTGRSDVRDPDDHYQTPRWAVDAVLPRLGDLRGKRILEPSAGRGAIVRALLEAGADPANVVAVEPNEERAAEVAKLGVHVERTTLEAYAARIPEAFDLSVGNPPFAFAESHVRLLARPYWRGGLLAAGGTVAVLARLAFFTESDERTAFRREHPHDRLELVKRPSFTREALAWLTEDDLFAMATAKERARAKKAAAKPRARKRSMRDRIVALVRSRLMRTDSCPYAWGLIGEGRGGRFWTHEEAA